MAIVPQLKMFDLQMTHSSGNSTFVMDILSKYI